MIAPVVFNWISYSQNTKNLSCIQALVNPKLNKSTLPLYVKPGTEQKHTAAICEAQLCKVS
jgi:hypothetical protein